MNKTTIVIPLYQPDVEFLLETLRKIVAEQSDRFTRIILVDDGSPTPVSLHAEEIKTISKNISLMRELNKGPAGARNEGIRHASTDTVVFLDQDCRPMAGWLNALLEPIETRGMVGVMGMVGSFPQHSRIAAFADYLCLLRKPSLQKDGSIKILITANSAFRKDALMAVNGFDEHFLGAGEDLDLTYRLSESGYGENLSYAEDAIVLHRHRSSFREFYRQQFGYGFGTMIHCLLRKRDTEELGFTIHGRHVGIMELLGFFKNADATMKDVSAKKYGFLNKLFVFPFLEYARQYARTRGHIAAVKEFGSLMKRLDTVDVRNTVKLILKDRHDKFLIVHKSDGTYGLIGGGVKKNETIPEALERECMEELGISTHDIGPLTSLGEERTQGRINYHFVATFFSGTMSDEATAKIKISEEHDALLWMKREDIPLPVSATIDTMLH
ncbi:MAG: glycosyltransferase [Candidatus Pacebacteria bacterium]|nr:glycosyltransferase [Candidatus Paceibacterota bacterium]